MAGTKEEAQYVLKHELAKVLGWDMFVVEGVVQSIVDAKSRADVQDLISDFMGNDPAAVKLCDDFFAKAASFRPMPKPQPQPSSSAAAAADGGRGGAAAGGASTSTSSAYQGGRNGGGGSGKGGAVPAWLPGDATHPKALADAAAADAAAARAKEERDAPPSSSSAAMAAGGKGGGGGGGGGGGAGTGSGKVLGMFKEGGKIRAPKDRPSSGAQAGGGGSRRDDLKPNAAAGQLERHVVNCLGCGKIYDCRSVCADVRRFLDRGGLCTFCGRQVALTYKDKARVAAEAEAAAAAAAAAAPDQGQLSQPSTSAAPGGGGVSGSDDATAAAVAFKNRLVEYDRNAAKRTTVIDDQSDYFEIDSNAWLTDEERAEMRRRMELEAEAEAARRKRVVITLDLIGRKVLQVEDGDGSSGGSGGAADAKGGSSSGGDAAAGGNIFQLTGSAGGAAGAGGGAAAAAAVSATQQQAQLEQELVKLKELRISCNPSALGRGIKPLFVPSAVRTAHQQHAGAQRQAAAPAAAAAAPGEALPQRAAKPSGRRAAAAKRLGMSDASSFGVEADGGAPRGRLQTDDVFDQFGVEVLLNG